jgi:hypothetical protein
VITLTGICKPPGGSGSEPIGPASVAYSRPTIYEEDGELENVLASSACSQLAGLGRPEPAALTAAYRLSCEDPIFR